MVDCSDPSNKENPECKISGQPNLFNCLDPSNKDIKECKITPPTDDDIKLIEEDNNQKICDSLDGKYDPDDKICVIPSKNYLSLDMNTFDDIFGKKYQGIITQLKTEIARDSIANFIFEGPPGLGKSQIARLIPKEYARTKGYDVDSFLKYNVKEINGSEKLGVDFIRESLDKFIKTKPFVGYQKFLVIDEAERLSPEAQSQLKTVITEVIPRLHNQIAIILTTNHAEKLDPTLSSSGRFHTEEFGRLDDDDMIDVMKMIQERESIPIPIDKQQSIIDSSGGSVRNLLENMYRVSEGNTVYDYSVHETIVYEKRKKAELERAKLEAEELEVQNAIKKEEIQARKFAIDNLGKFTNEEILDSLLNSPGVPPEMLKEYMRNQVGLRYLYTLQTHSAPSDLSRALQNRQKELQKQRESNARSTFQQINNQQEQADKIPLYIPPEIHFQYRGKEEEVNLGNVGGKELLELWALAQKAEETQNEKVIKDMYGLENHLIFEMGTSKDYVKNLVREARKQYQNDNSNNTNFDNNS